LIGEIPPEIANLEALDKLILSDNCLFGTMPSELGLLTNLYHLDITANGLSGVIPEEFFSLSKLSYLDISWQSNNHDNCTASDGRVVQPLYKMGDEDLGWNYGLETNFLEKISRLENLVYVNLDQNYFTGSVSDDIKNLQQLGEFVPLKYNESLLLARTSLYCIVFRVPKWRWKLVQRYNPISHWDDSNSKRAMDVNKYVLRPSS
jgi:hypothetical protein